MGVKLFIVTKPPEGGYQLPDGTRVEWPADLPIGAMWPCDCHNERGWLIRLPDNPNKDPESRWGNIWCTLLGDDQNRTWNVTGEAPNITVQPSIFCDPPTGWHGFITNGELNPA